MLAKLAERRRRSLPQRHHLVARYLEERAQLVVICLEGVVVGDGEVPKPQRRELSPHTGRLAERELSAHHCVHPGVEIVEPRLHVLGRNSSFQFGDRVRQAAAIAVELLAHEMTNGGDLRSIRWGELTGTGRRCVDLTQHVLCAAALGVPLADQLAVRSVDAVGDLRELALDSVELRMHRHRRERVGQRGRGGRRATDFPQPCNAWDLAILPQHFAQDLARLVLHDPPGAKGCGRLVVHQH